MEAQRKEKDALTLVESLRADVEALQSQVRKLSLLG